MKKLLMYLNAYKWVGLITIAVLFVIIVVVWGFGGVTELELWAKPLSEITIGELVVCLIIFAIFNGR
jgi:hypothetical protein